MEMPPLGTQQSKRLETTVASGQLCGEQPARIVKTMGLATGLDHLRGSSPVLRTRGDSTEKAVRQKHHILAAYTRLRVRYRF